MFVLLNKRKKDCEKSLITYVTESGRNSLVTNNSDISFQKNFLSNNISKNNKKFTEKPFTAFNSLILKKAKYNTYKTEN